MLLIPNQKFCTRHIEIAKHSLKDIRTDNVVGMSMNAERDPIPITPPDLGRSDTKTLLRKILD
jgi:hypothetical protein